MGVVRIGLLTTAGINRKLLAQRHEGAPYAFAAVGSRELGRAEAYAREHGLERAHGSYEELLADRELDAVYIALPNALHHDWTLRALAAGKHVLVEKPYSRRPGQVDEAWDEAERGGLVVMEAYMWRHSRQTALMLQLLPRIGELVAITSSFSFDLSWEDDVRLDRDLGGGALLDVGCYCVSASRLLAGREPDRVYAEQSLGRGGVDERFAGLLRFGEVFATFQCGFGAEHRSLVAIGTTGELRAPDPWHASEARVFLNGEEHPADDVDPYRLQLENFAAAVRGDEAPLLGRADALGQARTLDALLRSAEFAVARSL
jgi:D-xylose 1-dehydrogenase (NADP+, D-xylono-1,5-lactone-forming)